MSLFETLFFCCFDQVSPLSPTKNKKHKQFQSHIHTKYNLKDIIMFTDDERRQPYNKAYCCPICTNYYSRTFVIILEILACNECSNCICHRCCQTYEETC